jgi:hypothetical protein
MVTALAESVPAQPAALQHALMDLEIGWPLEPDWAPHTDRPIRKDIPLILEGMLLPPDCGILRARA